MRDLNSREFEALNWLDTISWKTRHEQLKALAFLPLSLDLDVMSDGADFYDTRPDRDDEEENSDEEGEPTYGHGRHDSDDDEDEEDDDDDEEEARKVRLHNTFLFAN